MADCQLLILYCVVHVHVQYIHVLCVHCIVDDNITRECLHAIIVWDKPEKVWLENQIFDIKQNTCTTVIIC